MTDYTDEIKNRLNAYIHWKQKVGESIEDSHAPDIANLLAEREVLREALKHGIAAMNYAFDDHCDQYYVNVQKKLEEALAWEPKKP